MGILDEFLIKFEEIAINSNKYKDELVNTQYKNAWRTAYVLWQNAYAARDLIVMFNYLIDYNISVTNSLEKSGTNIQNIDEILFYARKHLINTLRWYQEIKYAGCDNITKIESEVDKFIKLIDSFISYIQNYEI